MNFDLNLFVRALGLAFVLEGLFWFAFPNGMRSMMSKMLEMNDREVRNFGLIGMAIGLATIWLVSF
ncbi:MAG: DUF2065 domain-containing protein [Desulfovibrionaceae bacterium]|nr:DUF2065 domain-containing protein [Desulfovibrionaceae bacterium]